MTRPPNERSAGNGGTVLLCHIGRSWPAVPEPRLLATLPKRHDGVLLKMVC